MIHITDGYIVHLTTTVSLPALCGHLSGQDWTIDPAQADTDDSFEMCNQCLLCADQLARLARS